MLTKLIRSYLADRKNEHVVVDEIAAHLKQDREVVLHALNFLVHKGIVKVELSGIPCKGCSCVSPCKSEKNKFYKII